MALSTELISQFAKVITPKETRPEFTTVTGRAKLYEGKMYVQIDGSNGQLTPIASSTVGLKDNDWVTVQIKNHSATVTGNATDPSAGTSYADDIKDQVDNVSDQISEFEIVIADKVDVDVVNAISGRIDDLVSENVTITGKLDAAEAEIDDLQANNVTITGKLEAAEGDIDHLESSKADISVLESEYATIKNLEATNANIHNLEADYGSFKDLTTDNFTAVNGSITNLETNKLDVIEADIKYANIDFSNIDVAAVEELFAKSGIIEDLVVSGGHITGELVGVTIKGDLIEGNTIKADKLVVLGEDGLYYKLNVGAETVAAQQTQYNSLNGSIITANTITAEKINVDDLVAFNATVGGFHLNTGGMYSGVKSSVDNTTQGIYLGSDGQLNVGDGNQYLKFYKDATGVWKLEIAANSIKMGTTSITDKIDEIENKVNEIENNVDSIDIGGRNYVVDRAGTASYSANGMTIEYLEDAYFHIYGTNTGDAAYGLGAWLIDNDLLVAGQVYTISTTVPMPEGVYLQLNTKETSEGTEVASGIKTLSGDGETLSSTGVCHDPTTGYANGFFGIMPTVTELDITFRVKFEKGNRPTDWTPAPEDVNQDISNATEALRKETNVFLEQTSSNIRTEVEATYTTKDEADNIVSQFTTSLEQTENSFNFSFEQILGDLTALGDDTEQRFTDISRYIRFVDGNIILGEESNPVSLKIENDRIAFLENGNEVMYISNEQLYIMRAIIATRLDIGQFAWIPRSNGNVSFRYNAE